MGLPLRKPDMTIRLPAPHKGGQEVFYNWSDENLIAQCLVAPCGTKVGKTFGSVLWMLKEALVNKGLYCAWIAPTYQKCRIAYRYFKSMLPNHGYFTCVDGRLEIQLANGSFIKFMHGKDAEVTVEGEAIDRFVIDEAGKIKEQVWLSLLTTITQTRGFGIVTGTPRGHTWYYDIAQNAQDGNDFFVYKRIKTEQSPFVTKESIERNRKLLPPHLFDQYYNAVFTKSGSVFGDISKMWTNHAVRRKDFWIHPEASLRHAPQVHGVDIAKKQDWTVFYSVNPETGDMTGFCRFRHVPYIHQVIRLKTYLTSYFGDDNTVRYDATGVGEAFGEILGEAEIDASIEPVVFTNKSKSEMVTKTILSVQTGWHHCPRIPVIENEWASYELTVTDSGLYRYGAPEGCHDDTVSAGILAISEAYSSGQAEQAEKELQSKLSGRDDEDEALEAYSMVATGTDNEFFDAEEDQSGPDFDFDLDSD